MTESSVQFIKPLSTKELASKAQDFEFNPLIPLKFWIRTSDNLLREASIYEQEGNDQQAFLLLMRYAALVAERFPSHPSFRDPEYKLAINSVKKNLTKVLDSMEGLKPRINRRHNAWEQAEALADTVARKHNRVRSYSSNKIELLSDPAITGSISTLAAAENKELAVRLAQEEITRRNAMRRDIHQTSIPETNEHKEQKPYRPINLDLPSLEDDSSGDEIQRRLQESKQLLSNSYQVKYDHENNFFTRLKSYEPSSFGKYRYPIVTKPQIDKYGFDVQRGSQPAIRHPTNLPPKDTYQHHVSSPDIPPTLPQKLSNGVSEQLTSLKSNIPAYTFRPSYYLENGEPLRTIFLPIGLHTAFLKQVESNTKKKLETCGMLCGTLVSNALFIRCVVIPEQESTCDTCETTNEGALVDYCNKEDLLVLGWIHTHPTQSCFMSSRDLHTQCGYQTMMPESIAIVCAPSKIPSWDVFRLTDPPGLGTILNCKNTALFHPHSTTNLYKKALHPGHVVECEELEFSVVDLRPR